MVCSAATRGLVFNVTRKLICRPGASKGIGRILGEQGCRRALLVTDPNIRKLGLLDSAIVSLEQERIGFEIFDEVHADPAVANVESAVAVARAMRADHVIGFGGGSPMDVAKLVACLAEPNNSQVLDDMYGVDMVTGRRLPLTLVPTTAGSGSEATSISIVTDSKPHEEPMKKAVVSPMLLPDQAILDAELTLGLPRHVSADTGMDAIVHCIEAFTSRLKRNRLTDALAKGALDLLSKNVRIVVHSKPHDVEARSNMLLGSYMAGMAFNNAPVGAVHALAYPLGSHFHISHGSSNSVVLPHVLNFNRLDPRAAALYTELALCFESKDGVLSGAFGDAKASAAFVRELKTLQQDLGMRKTLREFGITRDDVPLLAREAMKQTRLLPNNIREIGEDDIGGIYLEAL
mmetsp:Transcript_110739/g.352773  ORF Transcript_110739/g.352773 Transcript_110739/m.352773 type:complete len:404 (+) Transcript_110739:65-1276(+)|eukprot:CAMPEP_0203890108 /NCGR_PEP_ID=MMETSP0359-20131031/33572_1 /ASSEMBLY_ACC=CAM_ASM_000338 /TAXON_ID=268821 /ORGANISM="Scrippsiella Hangoei, Strain SHTV-5" /LENGTH=403 /DNA_ID=CAMNT_0050811655 /DNA_START=41 /DNA_END=1252 /DNA_ORIENTATION=-